MNRTDRLMIVSRTLVLAGTVAGIVAASRTPVHVELFLLSASAAAAGVILDHARKRLRPGTAPGRKTDRPDAPASIASLLGELRTLSEGLGRGGDASLPRNLLAGPEADYSERIVLLHGAVDDMTARADPSMGAHMKILLSEGERFLNRARSALSDGFPDEAARSVEAAIIRFEEVERLLPPDDGPPPNH